MTSFKKGSGNLDFGEETDETEKEEDLQESDSEAVDEERRQQAIQQESADPDRQDSRGRSSVDVGAGGQGSADFSEPYPYFVRRNNVGDERDDRLELHVRDVVTEREPAFRNALAQALNTDEVSKTDAREFALLYAFQNPEGVAELMRDEGFNALDR